MERSYADRPEHLGAKRPPLAAGSTAPRVETKSANVVGSLVLVALILTAAIAVAAMAPLGVTLPIGVVLFSYLIGSALMTAGERSAQQQRAESEPTDAEAAGAPADDARSAAPEERVSRTVGTLAVTSLVLLIAGALVPVEIGAAFAAVGLTGLLIARIVVRPVILGPRPDLQVAHR